MNKEMNVIIILNEASELTRGSDGKYAELWQECKYDTSPPDDC